MRVKKTAAIFLFYTTLMSRCVSIASQEATYVKADSGHTQLEDIDKKVTDSKLRVESGKKSKWSSSASLTYKGGPLNDPTSVARPPIGDQTRPEDQSLTGNFLARYRHNSSNSYVAGIGLFQQRPFHDSEPGKPGKKTELFSPQIGHNYTDAIEPFEFGVNTRAFWNTMAYKRDIGELWAIGTSLSLLSKTHFKRVKLGASVNLSYTYFDKDNGRVRGKTTDLRPLQVDYGFHLSPVFQYNFTEKLNIFTSSRVFSYTHRRIENRALTFKKQAIEQTIGFGYSILRDVFLSPSLTFEPEEMRADRALTNVRLSVNL